MREITREQIYLYLDNALSENEASQVEQAIRSRDDLKLLLRTVLAERDRGDHSVGAVWRREHLSCPSREQLGAYLLRALDDDVMDYVHFHLEVIACPFCRANRDDLKALQQESQPKVKARRQRIFESSIGLIKPPKRKK
jgi:hypothetical protein